MPLQRWDIEQYYAPEASRNLTMDVRLAAFVDGFDAFDPALFRQEPCCACSFSGCNMLRHRALRCPNS